MLDYYEFLRICGDSLEVEIWVYRQIVGYTSLCIGPVRTPLPVIQPISDIFQEALGSFP